MNPKPRGPCLPWFEPTSDPGGAVIDSKLLFIGRKKECGMNPGHVLMEGQKLCKNQNPSE